MWLMLTVIAVVVLAFLMYNSLVRLRVQSESAWSDIDVQLKRRTDLVPNLVETVRGYASHEKDALESVIEARSRALSASGPAERAEAENMLTSSLRSIFALAEAYPQLRASDNFSALQASLERIEHDLQNARRYYNAVVRDLNTRIQQVPWSIIAKSFGFREREFFEIEESERAVPKVSF